uniref:Uncharacterized protein n=1 Tax=Daphnia galeata TaxID=27404 RepID=A0A8J2RT07_9CRUS|nr:unnamed protein product [Daphnia galeata]
MSVDPALAATHPAPVIRCQASNYFGVHNNTPPFAVQSYGLQKQQKHYHLSSSHHSRQQQHTIVSSVQLDLNPRLNE